MIVEDEDLVNDGNVFEDGVVEGSIVAVISLFVDLADVAVSILCEYLPNVSV